MTPDRRRDSAGDRRAASVVMAAAAVLAAVYVVSLVPGARPGGSAYVAWLDFGVCCAVMAAAAASCALRAVHDRPERVAWGCLAVAIAVYLAGNCYYYLALADLPAEDMPYPSWADAGWLAWYPLLAAAIVALVRARVRGSSPTVWLDGIGAGLGAAAVVGAVAIRPLLADFGGDAVLVVVNLAYPIADLALLVVAVAALHLNGWRAGRTWWWLVVGGGLLLLGDFVYLLQVADGAYVEGGAVDATWPLACLTFGLAAASRRATPREVSFPSAALVVPIMLTLAGTAVLAVSAVSRSRLPVVVCVLGASSVLLAGARLVLTLGEVRRLAEARREARTDELTGLPNRREVMDRITGVVQREDSVAAAVLLIDLDRFKEVNDTLGHHHGDQLLRAVAQRIGVVFRDGDTVARLGGDEFAVLLPDVSGQAEAERLARRCIDALEDDFAIEGVTLQVDASIGVALTPDHGRDGHALMRAADVAMYEAKSGHRGVVVYDPAGDQHTPMRLALLGDLRRALQGDEIVLHYQPKVGLQTGEVIGVEALIRWLHPVRGLLDPADFLPAAESTGLIGPLTDRSLRLAVAQAAAWTRDGHPLQVAVNLSARCLADAQLPARIRALLDEHRLPAALLRLELTETTLMADPAGALAVLSELEALGISLSIDDFGTGYSSMSHLSQMPVDELKIDRAFVLQMLSGSRDGSLVRSSIELGHSLGLAVVAEGVEDRETMQALADLGCDVVQGFHLARPMSAADVPGWLRAPGPHRPAGAAVVTPRGPTDA